MADRKFNSYTLWMKWRNSGWKPYATCLNLPWPSANPIEILKLWAKTYYIHEYWDRGKTWMILPESRKPKGYNK